MSMKPSFPCSSLGTSWDGTASSLQLFHNGGRYKLTMVTWQVTKVNYRIIFPNNPHIVWWIIFFIPIQMFSYMNTVEYILQCEIRLTHYIFINWKDFSSFLCQLHHMHRSALAQSKCYCNVFTETPLVCN